MLVVGITSGIGCGKSTVSAMFKKLGAAVIDADKIVGKLYKKNLLIKSKLVEEFGVEILTRRNKINSKKLASTVFLSNKKLKKLNSIVHPFVFAEIKRRIKSQRKGIVVIDVPLLIETGMASLVDVVVVVKASKKAQMQRLKKQGYSQKEAKQRIAAQMPLREKIKLADYVIDNSGSISNTRKQAEEIFNKLKVGSK